jgi:hypothetical protein
LQLNSPILNCYDIDDDCKTTIEHVSERFAVRPPILLAMASPGPASPTLRRVILTISVSVITVMGAGYGANLASGKGKQQVCVAAHDTLRWTSPAVV